MKRIAAFAIASALLCASILCVRSTAAGATGAQSMICIENSTDRVLAEKNAHCKLPMASTTKIVTAITVIDHCDDLERVVTVPDAAVGVEGSSIYLEKGEKCKIIDLLYGLMLQSGNDCAAALAITIGGSIEKFADMMNDTAAKVGVTDSHFVTPHGLHHDEHYTTAYDLAKITSYAMKNATFAKIVATKRHTMPWQGRNYDRVILNKNKILSTFEGGDGVKTGFTKKAGRCLVSSATRDGMRVICVVLNCGPMFEDCSAIMERAFRDYKLTPLLPEPYIAGTAQVIEGAEPNVEVGYNGQLYYPLKADECAAIRIVPEIETLLAPFGADTPAGKFSVYLDKQLLFTEKLVTIKGVQAPCYGQRLMQLVRGWTSNR